MAAAAGLLGTCILPSEPSTPLGRIQFILPADTLLLAIAGEISPAIQVRAEGKPLSAPRLRFETGDSSRVVVDESGKIIARKRGPAPIRVTLVSGATGETPPETTLTIKVIVGSMRPARGDTSLAAFGDTVFFRPGYLDAGGVPLSPTDSAAIKPRYQLVSAGGAGRTVALDTSTGAIVAFANGADTVRATVDTSSVSLAVTVRQVPTKLAFGVQPSAAAAGAAIAPAVQVAVQDARGNAVAGATAAVTLALGVNPVGGTLSGTLTRSAANGLATFSDLSLDKVGTGYTLTAAAGGLTGAASAAFTIVPGLPTQLAFSVLPSAAVAGAPIAPAVQVAVEDSLGNPVPSATNLITMAIGTNPGGGTLAGTVSKSAVNGTATFSDLSITKAGSGYTFTASASGLAGAGSSGFDISASSVTKLAFITQPTNAQAGTSISPTPQVAAQDAFGNTVTGFAGSIMVAITSGTGNPSATLSGTTTAPVVAGVATFSDLSIDKASNGYLFTAAATGLTAATSASFDVTPGTPKKLAFAIQPGTSAAGAAVTPAVRVAVQDALGNTVTSATSVSVEITGGSGNPSGTLGGTTTVAAVGGVASFSTLNIDKTGSGYTLTATGTGLTGATSNTFNVSPGAASRLAFTVQPSTAIAGATAIAPDVTVQDAFGNTVTTATTPIAIAIGTNAGGGTLAGTTPKSAASGVASFSDLNIDKAGTGYTLTATASGLTGATSAAFDMIAGPATKLAFTAQPSVTQINIAIQPDVLVAVQDVLGNTVTSPANNITVAIGNNPALGMLSGTNPKGTVNGIGAFSNLSINNPGMGYTLVATSGLLTSATSAAFEIKTGPPEKLAFIAQPTTTEAGNIIAAVTALKVAIQDGSGTTLNTRTDTVTLAITSGTGAAGATLSGTVRVSAVAGVATFSGLSINKAASNYKLTATATGLTATTSSQFDITPGTAARLAFTVQPVTTTAGPPTVIPAVSVAIQDALGNTVTIATNSITVAITNGTGTSGATLSGTKTVSAAGGIAIFSTLSIDKAGSGYTITVTATGLTSAASAAFGITPGATTKLAFTVQPSATKAGSAITPAAQVTAQDALGNTDTTFAGSITVAIGTNPTSGSILSGTVIQPATNPTKGIATFSNLSIDRVGAGYTLTATSSGLSSATSGAFNITATRLVFTVQPTTVQAGSAITPAVQVAARDAAGNTDATFTGSVTLAITSGTGTAGATLLGTATVTAVAGVATFSNVSIDKVGTGYTLTASTAGLTSAVSGTFNITPGAASRLAFIVQPSNTKAGSAITPAIQVVVQDAFGNTVTSATNSITMLIGANPGGGTLSGTIPRAAVAGLATFTDLRINKAGTGYTLTATASGLTSATSAAFNITSSS